MPLDDLNDQLSMNLEAEDVDTLGGYVYAKLGRVPERGDQITSNGALLIVEEIEGNRINKVRIVKWVNNEPPADGEAGNADFTVATIPELDHWMWVCTQPSESGKPCAEMQFSPKVLDLITNWIQSLDASFGIHATGLS